MATPTYDPEPTRDDLLECLAEGQACVMDYFHDMLNIPHQSQLEGEPGRLAAVKKSEESMMKLMKWAMHRDDVKKRPHPLEAAWDFRQRAFDSQRTAVIKKLEEAIRDLKAQRPSSFETKPSNVPTGVKFPKKTKKSK